MAQLSAVLGDITTLPVDAIVNAANSAMRGGGGVDGAIHAAGGPEILRECIRRFPNGLATGRAGWTHAGNLPCRWVIHTVGPNYAAGQHDRSLLVSCYRQSLMYADLLGVRTLAFPIISAGIYGWPKGDAVATAVQTLATTETQVRRILLVAFDEPMLGRLRATLAATA